MMRFVPHKDLRQRLLLLALMLALALPPALLWGDDWVLAHRAQMLAWWPQSGLSFALVHNSIFGFYLAYLGLALRASWQRRSAGKFGNSAYIFVAYVLTELLVAVLVVRLLKLGIGRPRPAFFGQPWTPFAGQARFESLPSGHAADAAVGAGVADIFTTSTWLRLLAFAGLVLTMFGRIVEGRHYPSDLLLGAALGYAGSLLTAAVLFRYSARLRPGGLRARSAPKE